MRTIRVLGAVGVLAAAAFVAPAALAAGNWYARGDLSYNAVSNNGWQSMGTPVNTKYKSNAGLDLALGWNLGRVWAGGAVRGEFEASWKNNSVDSFSQNGQTLPGHSGHTRVLALMYNLYNDFLPESVFDPYLGAGIGYADIHYNYTDTGTYTGLESSDSRFAYQFMIGFKVRVTPSLYIDAALNHFVMANQSLTEAGGGGATFESSYQSNGFTLGVTWAFSG